ncbi:hypothetical protein AVEN_271755-1 [Araneus ventricosus]|uniref:Uncharacterized protein n=1 Tax=Araneus ventricosus TaxID=182803 RepID=A0A4Y2LQU4_ARAVE|nr:hypothetical protein AVEN_271755-1 [Araneus ventricosus]
MSVPYLLTFLCKLIKFNLSTIISFVGVQMVSDLFPRSSIKLTAYFTSNNSNCKYFAGGASKDTVLPYTDVYLRGFLRYPKPVATNRRCYTSPLSIAEVLNLWYAYPWGYAKD